MKRNKIRMVLAVCLIGVIGVWGLLVFRINRQIPAPEEITYPAEEWVDMGNGLELKTQGVRFMQDQEIREFPGIYEEALLPYEMKLIWLTVSFRNPGTESIPLDLLDVAMESAGWSNITDPDFYMRMKEKTSIMIELEPDEEVQCELPFLFVRANFRDVEWEKIEQKEYFVILKLYPQKIRVRV